MKKAIKFNIVEVTISREKLEEMCYIPDQVNIIETIDLYEEDMEEIFDPIVELFYNLLEEDGRLE